MDIEDDDNFPQKTGNPDFTQYPERVTLCFKNKAHKHHFLGQLSDGWGENYVSLDWGWNVDGKAFNEKAKFTGNSLDLYDAELVTVHCIDEYFSEENDDEEE